MKRKRILGLWLILLMLIMTACGSNKNAASGAAQGSEENIQVSETEVQESELIAQENDSETQKSEAEAEETESETQEELIAQKESEVQKDASKAQEESDAQEVESETQEQTQETEDSQQDAISGNLPTYGNYYYDVVNVVLYLDVYGELPPNYITKSEAKALGWEGGPVEKYKDGAAIGGDTFGNREGLLPAADGRSYTECDIDTHGNDSRGAKRLIFSNDGLYFYTSDHYESFSEVTVTGDYEVVW